MEDSNAGRIFEASNVYKLNGTNQYVAIIEAFEQTSDNHRYFRRGSRTASTGPGSAS